MEADDADLEQGEDDERMEAPTTPGTKRTESSGEGHSTPKKTRGPQSAGEVQQQFLQSVLSLQKTTDDTKTLLNKLTDRVMQHDEVLQDIGRKFGVMQVGHDKENAEMGTRIDKLQNLVENNQKDMVDMNKRLEARPAATTTSATSSSTGSSANLGTDEVIILGGFNHNTPRAVIEQTLRPLVKNISDSDLAGEVRVAPQAPYLLGSCGDLRLRRDLAHRLMQATRQKDYLVQVCGVKLCMWATVQKPKDVRDRNKKLIKLADIVQSHLRDQCTIVENLKVICRRSVSVVVAGRKILSVVDGQTSMKPNWFDDKIWETPQSNIEGELMKAAAE